MRYTILRPSKPFDPRNDTFKSMEDLRRYAPSIGDYDLEREAANRIRELYPDAVVMPVPIGLGSGETYLLGVLESIDAERNPERHIPFVAFVQAISQHIGDERVLKKRGQFTRSAWKCPVLAPTPGDGEWADLDVELRGTNLEQPVRIGAVAYRRTNTGNVVLYLKLPDVEMSIELLDPMPVLPVNVPEEFTR